MTASTAPVVAFLGPSLPAAAARAIVGDVVLRPPICQGDLSSVVHNLAPRAVLIVDGEFGQSLSVWHKEILFALHTGVRVLGASSMGALRAAELDRFGMEGVGEVYTYYRDGWLTDDADVALLYANTDTGYRALTWPLVNVRATVAALVASERVTEVEAGAVTGAAAALHFGQRTEPALARALNAGGIADAQAARLARLVAVHYVDQKARDAEAGFERLKRLDASRPGGEAPRHRDGRGFQPLLWSDVVIDRSAGSLRRYQVVDDAALWHPDFDALLERALDRHLIGHLADESGIELSEEELAEQRRRRLQQLGLSDDELGPWLEANDMTAADFAALIASQAKVARMRRWLLDSRLYERNRRLVIEQLRLEGRFAAVADAAARRRTMTAARPPAPYPQDEDEILELYVRQRAASGWQPGLDLVTLADEQGFDSFGGLLVALADSVSATTELQQRRARAARMLGFDGERTAGSDGAGRQAGPPPSAGGGNPGGPSGAARVHALLESHQVTHTLLAAVRLGLFDAARDGPVSAVELSAATGARVDRLERLLDALRALRLVERRDERWSLTADGALLTSGTAGHDTLADYAQHLLGEGFAAWGRLADVVQGADQAAYPSDETSDRAIGAATTALDLATVLLRRTSDLRPGSHVADVGGGLGGALSVLAEARPDLRLTLVELPDTAARAAARQDARATGGQFEIVSYTGQPRLDPRVDCCVLQRVVITLTDAAAVELLQFARRSLRPGGHIEVIDVQHDGSPQAVLGDLLNLARSNGSVRSSEEWHRICAGAGLRIVDRQVLRPPFLGLRLEPLPNRVAEETADPPVPVPASR